MIYINIHHEHYTFTQLACAVMEIYKLIEWSMSTLTPFLCLKDNRYSFEDDSKEPKIDLSRFGWCFEIEKGWRASPYSWIQSVILNNHLSLHNQQRRECPSFWLDGHLPPSGNHTILLLERIPHFNFPQFSNPRPSTFSRSSPHDETLSLTSLAASRYIF